MPFSRGFPNPGIEPGSPALQADSLLSEPPEEPLNLVSRDGLLILISVSDPFNLMSGDFLIFSVFTSLLKASPTWFRALVDCLFPKV